MFLSFIAPALGFLKRIPREVWYVLAVLAFLWWYGHSRYDAGWEAFEQKLKAAQAEAAEKAFKAERSADANERERADEFQAEQEAMRKAIEAAEKEDTNALDALF